jgi:hypothetical protein
MFRTLSACLLGAMLCGPAVVSLRADDEHHEREKERRYYDNERRDYHEWNEHENRAYRRWMEERHERQVREFNRLNAEQQREYWRWRHNHPDTTLWPNER